MRDITFDTAESFKDKYKRFFKALSFPLIKFSLISTLLYYFKTNTKALLTNHFDISHEKDKTALIWQQVQQTQNELSLSISKITDYISKASSGAISEAKIYSIEKLISLFSGIIELGISLFWIYLIFSFISSVKEEYFKKEEQNEIANLVVQKLLPIIKKQNEI